MKRCIVKFLDGFTATAAINDTPANGNTELDIDTVSDNDIAPGTRFTIAGVDREYHVLTVVKNEIQLVTVDATSGNFTLGFIGTIASPISVQTTASIAEGATAAAVQTELEALAALVPGDVAVTGSAGGPFTIEFTGNYAGVDIGLLVATDVDLMGGGSDVVATVVNAGGAAPNRITFTPALLTADTIPSDDDVITFGPHTLTIKTGDGEVNYEETKPREYELDRGELDDVVDGDQEPMQVSLAMKWEELTAIPGAETPTPEDVIKFRGPAAGWTSSDADDCRPPAIDIEITHTPRCAGGQLERVTLPDFRYETLPHSYNDGTISMTGRCNAVEALIERIEQ